MDIVRCFTIFFFRLRVCLHMLAVELFLPRCDGHFDFEGSMLLQTVCLLDHGFKTHFASGLPRRSSTDLLEVSLCAALIVAAGVWTAGRVRLHHMADQERALLLFGRGLNVVNMLAWAGALLWLHQHPQEDVSAGWRRYVCAGSVWLTLLSEPAQGGLRAGSGTPKHLGMTYVSE